MNASVVQPGGTPHSWSERVAVAALAVVIVLGSALVWIGVPVAGLWLAGRITTDPLRLVTVRAARDTEPRWSRSAGCSIA